MSHTFQTIQADGLPIHFIHTKKYKTNFIQLSIRQKLDEEHYTKVALLPAVLKRGSKQYPSAQKIGQALDDFYGATLTTDVQKRGEEQVMIFRLQLANETYLVDTTPLFEKGLALLSEILTNPLLEDGVFHSRHVQIEKDLLQRKLRQIKDDKIRYANKRCIEEMFRDEAYSLYTYGSETKLAGINPRNLYEYYQQVLRTHPMECFVAGDIPEEEVKDAIQRYLRFPREQVHSISRTDPGPHVSDIREVQEKANISQGKLHIGCRTHTVYADDDFIPLMVMNGLFGGFSHSKLFRNVREKESLAYYVSSSIESHKGLMMIAAGVDVSHYQKTVDIIRRELDHVVQGKMTDEEVKQTQAMLTNQILESGDRPFQLMERHFQGIVGGRIRKSEQTLADIEQVSKEDIQRVAEKVEVDTIYFLTSGEKDGE